MLEDHFLYFPAPYPEGDWSLEARDPGPPVEGARIPSIQDVSFRTADGLEIHGWLSEPLWSDGSTWSVPEQAQDRILLYLHGNAGNVSHRSLVLWQWASLPIHVLILDYRGYGRSEGRPSEQGFYQDAEAAWSFLLQRWPERSTRTWLYGESIGGAVATHLATQVDAAGLILQSTFTSIPAMARSLMPWMPRFLIQTQMNTLEKVVSLRLPKLILHSPEDEIVPIAMGQELFKAAAEPKTFHQLPPIGHNETFALAGRDVLSAIRPFLGLPEER